MKTKLILIYSFLFILFLISISSVIASESDIKLDTELAICINSFDNCYNLDINNISTEDTLFLKLITTNGEISTLCWDNWNYNIMVQHEEDKQEFLSKTYDAGYTNEINPNFCLPGGQKSITYIPFDYYNKKSKEDRLDLWKLKPSISFNNLYCFQSFNTSSSFCYNYQPKRIEKNQISFKVIAPKLEIDSLKIETNENIFIQFINFIKDWIVNNLTAILVGIIIIVVAGIILHKYTKKR